jgi:hypothetical protein
MPEMVRREDFTSNLFTFLTETFESPPKPSSAYLDQKTGCSILSVLSPQKQRPSRSPETAQASPLRWNTQGSTWTFWGSS